MNKTLKLTGNKVVIPIEKPTEPTERQWIITIHEKDINFPDGKGVVTGTVGPFPDEETADRYCRVSLEPNLANSKFVLSDLENPEQFIRDMLLALG